MTALFMNNEELSAMTNLTYMSLVELDVLANESAARLMFCLNAQKKPFNSHKQGIVNFVIVFSKG